MASSQSELTLVKYKDAFVRTYQSFFTQYSLEEERVEAATQLFNTVKTPSELAKVALTLKLIQPVVGIQRVESKSEEIASVITTQLQRNDFSEMREKPAQNKLAREIELINQRIQELYELRKLRELSFDEQDQVRTALTEREELRKRLKKTQDAAIRAKRYRIRKATLMSTDSDFGSLDTAEPVLKFSRSHSTNVLMSSEEPKDHLTIRTTRSEFNSVSRENSICLTVTPTPEISKLNLNISPAISFPSIKHGNSSPKPKIIELDCTPPTQNRRSTTEEENISPSGETSNCTSLQCQQCTSSFVSLNEFIDHMRTTHLNNNNDFTCSICDRVFNSQQDRLVHSMEHYITAKTNYYCQKCDRHFLTATTFRQHFVRDHTEILFRCNICLQLFTDNNVYQDHILRHAAEEITLECALCEGLSFDNQDKFITHIQLAHERPDSELPFNYIAPRKIHGLSSEDTLKTSKSLKCFVCDASFPNENELDSHRLLNHCKVVKSDRCGVCRQKLANLDEFFQHTREHCTDLNEVNCVICRQSVRNETLLRLHGEYHLITEELQQTTCQICLVSVPPESLAQHILQHTFEKSADSENSASFVCQCGEKFLDPSELQVHSLVHLKEVTSFDLTKQKTFVCDKCDKTFPSVSALQGHSHVHISRKHSCKTCHQSFSTLSRLESHEKRHLGKNANCQICDEKFDNIDELQAHLRIHEKKLHSFADLSNE